MSLLTAGCAVSINRWRPPAVPAGWFSGLGSGSTCEEAKAGALKDLCESLFVDVRGATTLEDKQAITRSIGQDVKISYSHIADMVASVRSHCVFEGQPYQETRKTTLDNACHVQLRMSRQAFGHYLRSRTLTTRLTRLPEALSQAQRQSITTAVDDYLKHKGYLVLLDPDSVSAHVADIVLDMRSRTSPQDLHTATLIMNMRVLRAAGGRLDWAVTLKTTTRYGFSGRASMQQATDELVHKLEGVTHE